MIEATEITAPLAAALKDKGYETLTPVQEAVLAEGVAMRDLLVSAQTGSGKTVAFGIAVAPDLLEGADRFLFADTPTALVIAPTRELALQVARELSWLYAVAEARIATCVGGMDPRNERRALERGANIVVGTPGRLRDHIERGALDLSGIRAVVLDEADEMLDLGFAEDLEFILAAAPEDRRTLMFSATVPKEIAKLAATFQRDALRIRTAGEAEQHADIEYRAMSVQVRDREHAIFNILRYYEARTAIVFCKTRAYVNHLLARMGNRGFQVVALSGELSQQERMNALTALRTGRARVCIATDVAARGIDLPGLELVIHADLPSNPETLLHRSGRTGRAGSKGVSALIVTPSDFRKAHRILKGAKLTAEWGSAPSADEVRQRDNDRILEHPALGMNDDEDPVTTAMLLERFGAEAVARAFVHLWREGRSAPEELAQVPVQGASKPPRERGEFGPSAWFTVSVGHTGRAEARWILPKICDAAAISRDAIGAIRVQQHETFVQIAEAEAGKFGDEMLIDTEIVMRRLTEAPDLGSPGRKPARSGPGKGAAPRRQNDEKRPRKPKPSFADGRKPAETRKPSPLTKVASAVKPQSGPEPVEKVSERHDSDKSRKPRWSKGEKQAAKPARPRSAPQNARQANSTSKGAKPGRSNRKGQDMSPRDKHSGKTKGKPFVRSKDGGDARPTRQQAAKAARKPLRAAADARDTSKRFVPPKKPKA
ncbi:MAG: DEAD/DEAH box helicase [Pseudorhodobacter sp.]